MQQQFVSETQHSEQFPKYIFQSSAIKLSYVQVTTEVTYSLSQQCTHNRGRTSNAQTNETIPGNERTPTTWPQLRPLATLAFMVD